MVERGHAGQWPALRMADPECDGNDVLLNCSIATQGDHRIDFRSPPRREIACQ